MLPDSRNRTYTAATPVDPNDLNDLQDMVIGAKHSAMTRTFSPTKGHGNASTADALNLTVDLADAGTWTVPLEGLMEGDRITSVSVAIFGDGASDLNWNVHRHQPPMTTVSDSGTTETNPPAAWADYTYNVADFTLIEGEIPYVTFDAVGAGISIGPIKVVVSRP